MAKKAFVASIDCGFEEGYKINGRKIEEIWQINRIIRFRFAIACIVSDGIGADWISRLTRLDQGWSIFAPAPPRDDGWHFIPGKLKDGSEVDVLRGLEKPVSWEKPTMQERNALYSDMHWRTFFIALNRAIE